MTDGRVPRWAALVREAMAVLAAILVAFALDAWWDGRVERATMLEALDAVAIEIERNVAHLDATLAYNQSQAALVQDAVQLSAEGIEAMTDSDLARFADLPNYQIATLELGAVTAFIEGGFLAVLEDRVLRAELAGLPRLQVELDEEAGVVLAASETLTASLVDALPIEVLRSGGDFLSAESTRAIIRGIATEDESVRLLVARTFFLTYLYSGELVRTRDRLSATGQVIERFRGEG